MMNMFNGAIDENGKIIDESRLMFCTADCNAGKQRYYDEHITSANIRIAESWMENATMICEVQNEDGEWTLTQDGDHVNEMITKMRKTPVSFGGRGDFEGTVYDYLLFLHNRLGQSIDHYDSRLNAAYDTADALLDSREAVSGVNADEEGINMLVYKNRYNAAERMMTALDECLNKLINSTGRVGL